MNDEILRQELRRIAIENQHRCFGCGFENRCGIRGCAIIRQVLKRLESPGSSNAPLTLEELRKMDEEWVWIELLAPLYGMKSGYFLKRFRFSDENKFACGYPDVVVRLLSYAGYMDTWCACRRRPEEAP